MILLLTRTRLIALRSPIGFRRPRIGWRFPSFDTHLERHARNVLAVQEHMNEVEAALLRTEHYRYTQIFPAMGRRPKLYGFFEELLRAAVRILHNEAKCVIPRRFSRPK